MSIRCFVDVLKEKLARKDQSWLQEFVDYRLDGEFKHLQAVMVLKIGVSCGRGEEQKT